MQRTPFSQWIFRYIVCGDSPDVRSYDYVRVGQCVRCGVSCIACGLAFVTCRTTTLAVSVTIAGGGFTFLLSFQGRWISVARWVGHMEERLQ